MTTVSNLDGLFKDQFHKDIEDLKPQHVLLQDLIDWVPADKQNGEFYSIPTLLRSNQGVTYLGESGNIGTLVSAKPGIMKEAQVYGSEINVRGQLSYKALSQAASSGARAFKKASAWLVEDLTSVAHIRVEIAALYGHSGLGVVDTITLVSGTTYDIVVTEESFAPGIWVSLEGAVLEAFNGTTKVGDRKLTIETVTTSTRTVRVTQSGSTGTVAAANALYFEGANAGAGSFNEMCGLFTQMNTVSGTLFNIDRGAFSLMQGNVVSGVGALTKAKIVGAAMHAVDKGCMSELVCIVGTKSWGALNQEDMALRRFDGSYNSSVSESGNTELVYSNVNGKIKVICHPMVKNGHALIFNPKDVLWIGSSRPTFEIPGFNGEKFFRLVDGSNAVELQNYADLAVYAIKPSQTVLLTGITHS